MESPIITVLVVVIAVASLVNAVVVVAVAVATPRAKREAKNLIVVYFIKEGYAFKLILMANVDIDNIQARSNKFLFSLKNIKMPVGVQDQKLKVLERCKKKQITTPEIQAMFF
jgi:hypothetical protein